jgi:folate-dependent phosphoribosylglycinamide formyltransferase PurN
MDRSDIQQNWTDHIEVALRKYEPYMVYTHEGIRGRPPKPETPGPTGVVFVTSMRDTIIEDQNGLIIDHNGRPYYMKGLIEAVNERINDRRSGLEHILRIKGIITDDSSTDNLMTDQESIIPLVPQKGKPWLHPIDARDYNGELLIKNTHNIPSDFRSITPDAKDEREYKRLQFEEEVYRVSQQMGADILISDHLMVKLISLINTNRYSIGRVLNIHPGISDLKNPNRLPGATPTQDAIDRASLGQIYRKRRGIYLPRKRDPHNKTGASLHIVDEGLDTGPVIADSESTPVYLSDTPQELRIRNYPVKTAVFIAGITHYILTMIKEVDRLNFQGGERPESIKKVVKVQKFR